MVAQRAGYGLMPLTGHDQVRIMENSFGVDTFGCDSGQKYPRSFVAMRR
jgi:hypothetical protein